MRTAEALVAQGGETESGGEPGPDTELPGGEDEDTESWPVEDRPDDNASDEPEIGGG